MEQALVVQRRAFRRDGVPDAAARQDRIARLELLILDNADALAEAMRADFGTRAPTLSKLAEILGTAGDLSHQRRNVPKWMKPYNPGGLPGRLTSKARIEPTPKGVVGIMGPWNFPVNLVVSPAAAAFAAGNRVLIRPSEVTAHTTELLARLFADHFSPEEAVVFRDEDGDGAEFSRLEVDHLFFTGSPRVGALVAAAAGANLVPVTLELGGKNPAVVDRSADISTAARRLADSRLINGGQVCMCPDYALVPRESLEEFTDEVLRHWRSTLTRITDNPDYTSIIDSKNFERIVALVDDATAKGATALTATPQGEALPDASTRKIAPTVLLGVDESMDVDREEIFGPVLQVLGYDDLGEAIDHVTAREHPLTMYWFGDDNDAFARLSSGTRSGSIGGNDFAVMFANHDLPFGGVGRSGSGAYHGRFGFDTFSHPRAIAFTRSPVAAAGMLAPPFPKAAGLIAKAQLRMARKQARRAAGPRPQAQSTTDREVHR